MAKTHSSGESRRRSTWNYSSATLAVVALSSIPSALAQQCISLRGSTACPAFNQSSVSTSAATRGLYPFLAFVNDVNSFDTQLQSYISTQYSQLKYQTLLGCSRVNLTNTTELYARYTTTVLCNAIIQNSISACSLTGAAARPVCAETCAEFARSEESIASTPAICGTASNNALEQIRADYTTCGLPSDSLTANCIRGYQNEPDNCGFASNLPSLCSYCAASSPNSTDSCCIFSQAETRCQGVRLPITTAMGNLFPSSTSSAHSTATTGAGAGVRQPGSGLSGGAIAGIIIGSILGALLLLALLVAFCIMARRRRESRAGSVFNQPSPTRQGAPTAMSYTGSSRAAPPPDVLPAGGRVHHMAALESSSSHGGHSSPGSGAGFDSSFQEDSPLSNRGLAGAAAIGKRGGSVRESPPRSGDEFSSPEGGLSSGQSEQMSHFKDYYSQDDIHPGDTVAVLWAYQPRANDEWELERGDMIKVVGIWDDGWATGIKISETAEDWEAVRNGNRDSGLSNMSRQPQRQSSSPEGEIKAFPLVCVCLPQHWRKTIEGDTVIAEAGRQDRPGTP